MANQQDIKLSIKLLLEDKEALAALSKSLNSVKDQNEKAAGGFSDSWGKAVLAIGAVVAATEGFRRVAAYAILQASENEDAVNRLNLALRNQGIFTQTLSGQYQEMANRLQMASRFSDEAILEVQQRLVTIGNVGPAQMEKVIKATLDLAAAQKIELSTAGLLVAKAMNGQTEALSRYGIKLDENIPKSKRAAELLRQINDSMGGAAAADANTFAGAQEKVGKAFGEVLESLGRFVTESPQIKQAMQDISKEMFSIAEAIEKFRKEKPDALAEGFREFMALAQEVGTAGLAGIGVHAGKSLVENLFGSPEDNQAAAEVIKQAAAEVSMTAEQQNAILAAKDKEEALQAQLLAEEDARQKFIEGEVAKVDALRVMWNEWNNEKTAGAMAQIQAETDFLNLAIQTQQLAHESMWKTVGKARDTFSAGISSMFKDMVRGTFNAEEAFKKLGFSMLDILIDYGVQLAVNLALSKAFSATQAAISTTTAAIVAAAWAPAAAAASLATLGSNSGAAAAALTTTHALSRALSAVPALEDGGTIARAGMALVGERGPELVSLPSGATVHPNGTGPGHQISIHVEIHNPMFGASDLGDQIVQMAGPALSKFIQEELRVS